MCAVRVRVWYMPLRGLFDATISFIDALTALKLAFEIMHECMLYPHQSESSWHLHWVGEWVASVSEESFSLFHRYSPPDWIFCPKSGTRVVIFQKLPSEFIDMYTVVRFNLCKSC